MRIMLFTEELRKCLNAAGLSDCGENDAWNYWYQRVLKAHNEAVERQIATEQAENAELRELLRKVEHYERMGCYECPYADGCDAGTLYDENCAMSREIERKKHELGIEVDV